MHRIRAHSHILVKLYVANDFPSDRLFRNRAALTGLTDAFNHASRGNFSEDEVAAELERIRKDKSHTGGLPRLGRSYSGPKFFAAE